MWHLNLERLRGFVPGGSLGRVAIETGTCRGNGTRKLAAHFAKVITIELSQELSALAQARFPAALRGKVDFRQGNSAQVLRGLLPEISGEKPVFFFLDAHWSGDETVDWRKSRWQGYGLNTAHLGAAGAPPAGPEQCPLADELMAIAEHCRAPAYILIDDTDKLPVGGTGVRNRGFPGEDWSHLRRSDLFRIVEPRLEAVCELSDPDQLFLVISAKMPHHHNSES